MDSSPCCDAAQEPGTPRDPLRESSDDESLIDHKLEEVCKAALEANERFLDLQRQSHEKATPLAPALTPAPAVPPRQREPHQEHRAPPPPPEDQRGPRRSTCHPVTACSSAPTRADACARCGGAQGSETKIALPGAAAAKEAGLCQALGEGPVRG